LRFEAGIILNRLDEVRLNNPEHHSAVVASLLDAVAMVCHVESEPKQ